MLCYGTSNKSLDVQRAWVKTHQSKTLSVTAWQKIFDYNLPNDHIMTLIVVNKTAIKMHNQSCLMQTEYCNVQKISDKDLLFATD